MSNFVISGSPHIRCGRTTKQIMLDVVIALLPACAAGCVLLGWGQPRLGWLAFMQLAIASLSAVAAEFVFKLCCKKSFETILREFDFSSLVTGLLVGMNMYPDSAWYAPLLASVFAVVVVKMLFGGTGKNIVNPAVTGRIFAFISFGAAFGGTMTFAGKYLGATNHYITGATPLQILLGSADSAESTLTNLDLFLGTGVPGTVGETCKLALIVGGLYLVIRGVLDFRWPLVYVATTGLATVVISWITLMNEQATSGGTLNGVLVWTYFGEAWNDFLPAILSGGLILGAIFMATDYVTTPDTRLGNYIYFVSLGIVTAVLRYAVKGEAVSFAILLMNLTVPLIDKFVVRKPFGYVRSQKNKKEAN